MLNDIQLLIDICSNKIFLYVTVLRGKTLEVYPYQYRVLKCENQIKKSLLLVLPIERK